MLIVRYSFYVYTSKQAYCKLSDEFQRTKIFNFIHISEVGIYIHVYLVVQLNSQTN